MIRAAVYLLLACVASSAWSAELVFESKPTRTHLIELFTSEGCSSCLPAEAWLSGLKNEPRLWQDFVPVAFHVDYWDHLGWRDSFASKTWTERQADYSALWKSESVYTPAFVLDGVAWHSTTLPGVSPETVGVLKVSINGERVTPSFKPTDASKRRYEVHVARLGCGLGADVTAGENKGRKLAHDFIVLGLTHNAIKAEPKQIALPIDSTKATPPGSQFAVAAWVTESGKLPAIQATGGWLQ
jgi:hypothetical protein